MENLKLEQIEFVKDEEIKKISSIKTLGKIPRVYYPKNEEELVFIYNYLSVNNINFKIVGNGTNILFLTKSDDFFVISLKKIKKSIKKYKNSVIISSSTLIAEAFQFCYKNNLSCFEKLSTIPGTIGGAIKVNAGCFGENIFDNLISAKVLQNGKIKTLTKDKIENNYRKTNIQSLILSARFKTENKNRCELIKIASFCIAHRRDSQPKQPSLGCTFKNPINYPAGYLIEKCGLKGFKCNDAEISPVHANFIVNNGNATSEDILYLINLAKSKVKERFNIELELEIEIYP